MFENLDVIFAGEDYRFVVDTEEEKKYLSDLGQKVSLFDPNHLEGNAIVIQNTKESFNTLKECVANSNNVRVLSIPLIAFTPGFQHFKYCMNLLQECDFEYAFLQQKKILNILQNHGKSFLIHNLNHSVLQGSLREGISYSYPTNLTIAQNHNRSVAQYFELNFNHLYPEEKADYDLNGIYYFNACLNAVHPSVDKLDKFQRDLAQNLVSLVSNAKVNYFVIESNKIISFVSDGKEYINTLEKIGGTTRGAEITELAFGLNNKVQSIAKWHLNSQLNEGTWGIHLGIGDGKTGVHMDFISTRNSSNGFKYLTSNNIDNDRTEVPYAQNQ